MKKLKKISLHNLAQNELEGREQKMIKGGVCACGSMCFCRYAGSQSGPNDSYYGGSSTDDNGNANASQSANSNSN